MNANRIIGGNHGLPVEAKGLTVKKLSKTTLANARSCLYAIMAYLKMPVIWMPSYLCESLLHADYHVKFYEVDRSLTIEESFLSEIKQSEAVLVIDYFGFTQDRKIYERIKEKKGVAIEDASQSLLSERNTTPDFTIYSLTKCLGLPDGGMIESRDPCFEVEVLPSPSDFVESATNFRRRRAEFDRGENDDWYSSYIEHKKLATPIGPYDMSDLSKSLYESYDQLEIIRRTRENYLLLQKHLAPIKQLEEGVAPIGFPILHENRDTLLQRLIENKIYPPIHWRLRKAPKAFSDSHWVSERQITLPCDHRYGPEDMERIIMCVLHS